MFITVLLIWTLIFYLSFYLSKIDLESSNSNFLKLVDSTIKFFARNNLLIITFILVIIIFIAYDTAAKVYTPIFSSYNTVSLNEAKKQGINYIKEAIINYYPLTYIFFLSKLLVTSAFFIHHKLLNKMLYKTLFILTMFLIYPFGNFFLFFIMMITLNIMVKKYRLN